MKKLLLAGILFLGTLSYGGCKINLLYKNVSNQDIAIYNSRESAVKSWGGSWRSLGSEWSGFFHVVEIGALLASNNTMGATYNSTFRCNAKRRYRIKYSCQNGDSFTKYYPSSDKWTKEQTVHISIGQLCDEVQRSTEIRIGEIERNTDRMGRDYKQLGNLRDASVCQRKCKEEEPCVAWTFVKPNTIQGPKSQCYLKNSVPQKSTNNACESGVIYR